jgi:formylglycine-generating enzyme required for sulfatase activity
MICESPVLPLASTPRPWRDAEITPLMIASPSGEFVMGETPGDKFANDTERPAHRARIPAGRALGCFPVTVGEYRHFAPGHAPGEPEDWPVTRVNWRDTQDYCDWLTRCTGRAYRLPIESEWEFACRAGSQGPFATGDEITTADANYLLNESGARVGPGHRTPVGSYPANAFGFYDLHGNVCEWVADTWHSDYLGAPENGSAWLDAGERRRVIRGGAWDYLPRLLRSSWRDWCFEDQRTDNIGFRVAAGVIADGGDE